MIFACLKNNMCMDTFVSANVEILKDIMEVSSYLQQYDNVTPCPDGYGIGDMYNDGIWNKTEKIQELSIEARVVIQEQENLFLRNQIEITQAVLDQMLFGGVK